MQLNLKLKNRPSGKSIALAYKCAYLEGILKLSCSNVVKRISYIECSRKKAALKKLSDNALKHKFIVYKSLASSFVEPQFTKSINHN